MKSYLHKIRRRKITTKFSRKSNRYQVSENTPFILKPDPVYYGNLKIESEVSVLK